MNVSAVNHSPAMNFTQALQHQPENREIGPDRDGDADDAKRADVGAIASPSVNLSGQTVGQKISVTA